MGVKLHNDDAFLRILDNLGYIDITMPSWLNLNHRDPRKFISFSDFERDIELIDDAPYFVPDVDKIPIPVTELFLNIPYEANHSLSEVSVLATVCPLSVSEIGGQLDLLDDKIIDDMKKEYVRRNLPERVQAAACSTYSSDFISYMLAADSKEEKDRVLTENLNHLFEQGKNTDIFHPHVLGPIKGRYSDTILFYAFRDVGKQGLGMKVFQEALDKEYDDFVVRDSGISLQNRLKASLESFAKNDLLHRYVSVEKYSSGDFERLMKKKGKGAFFHHKINGGVFEKLAYFDIADAVKKTHTPFFSYVPVSLDEGESARFGLEEKISTFPVLLSNYDIVENKSNRILNYGVLISYGASPKGVSSKMVSSATVAFWKNKEFSKYVSKLISKQVGLDVQTVYAEDKSKDPLNLKIIK